MPGAGLVAFLQNFSTGEMVVIAIVAVVVLGPERLPEMARSLGKMLHKLKSMGEHLREEMGDVVDHPTMEPIKQLGELAANPRQKLAEYAMEAEAEERRRRAEAESVSAVPAEVEGPHVTEPDANLPGGSSQDEHTPDTHEADVDEADKGGPG
ncbi:MAG: twin-arginine translocase TatA/TatE family subunit [Actinomycetes bacterium]